LDAIERIEVAARTQWAHHLALAGGPHAHLDPVYARDTARHARLLETLENDVRRSTEPTIVEHLTSYSEPLPPSWVVCEAMSFGQLAQWIRNLASDRVRKRIAGTFGLPLPLFLSWLSHLVHVRNRAAHQGRMWNHEYTISPMRPIRHPAPLVQDWSRQDRRIHNTLLILLHLMKQVSPESSWPARLLELIKRFGHQWWPHMGFPDGWAQGPSWAPPLNGSPPGEP
ncbi:MAG: Abi family protein, partial [Deltaproteobacteria bacterium]